MIIFDTETTDLVKPGLVPLEDQPHIIEFAGIKLDDFTLNLLTNDEVLDVSQDPLGRQAGRQDQ